MRFILGLLLSATIATQAMGAVLEVAGGVEYFQWQEFRDSGSLLLEETGPRYFIEVAGTNDLDAAWQVDFGGRLYSGRVEYDGQTMSGIPVTTDTDYNGARAELGFVRNIDAGAVDALWQLRFALGLEQWRRNLRDTTLPDATPVSGYVERYYTSFARLGVSYHQRGAWSLGAGVKAPFNTREEVDVGTATVTLKPEGQLSLFAGAEVAIAPAMSVRVDYDSYRFARSDPQAGYYQPESRQDTLGIALLYRF